MRRGGQHLGFGLDQPAGIIGRLGGLVGFLGRFGLASGQHEPLRAASAHCEVPLVGIADHDGGDMDDAGVDRG